MNVTALLRRFFNLNRYPHQAQREQALFVTAFTLLLLLAYTFYAFFVREWGGGALRTMAEQTPYDLVTAINFYGFYLFSIVTLIALRLGRLQIASWSLLATWYIGGVLLGLRNNFASTSNGITLMGLLLLAGLVQRERGLLLTTPVALLTLLLNPLIFPDNPGNILTIALELLAAALLVYLFLRYAELGRSEAATEAVQQRLRLAQITTELSQRVSRRERLADVLPLLVERIVTAYDTIYHAQIFMVTEDSQEARLVASTGEVGKKLLERAHALAIGSLSVIGQVLVRREPVIAPAHTPDTIHRPNDLLPDTAVEAAFPLRIGDSVIGALDLQSKLPDAFADPDSVFMFTALAESIAIAVDNARLFEQAEQRIRENQQLVEQTRTALREVEQMNERLTGRAWNDYLRYRGDTLNLSMTFADEPLVESGASITPTIQQAIRDRSLVQTRADGIRIVTVPLRVRGQVVGAMEFELDEDARLSPDDLALLQDVSERFGLAAENTRLLEESQRSATRESLVNEISTRLQATNNVETTLAEAARSLQDALKTTRVAIRLGAPPPSEKKG